MSKVLVYNGKVVIFLLHLGCGTFINEHVNLQQVGILPETWAERFWFKQITVSV